MIGAFLKGIAGVNVLADHAGAAVLVADLGIVEDVSELAESSNGRLVIRKIQQGTNNLAKGPAMTRAQAEQAVMIGFTLASEQYAAGVDILATGDMGIGNTTPSSAIAAVLTGESLDIMVGRGTGVDNPGLQRKKTRSVGALKSTLLILPMVWTCCPRSAVLKSAVLPGLFWPQLITGNPWSSTGSFLRPGRSLLRLCVLPLWTMPLPAMLQLNRGIRPCSPTWAWNPSSVWACAWEKDREPLWPFPSWKGRSRHLQK